MQRMNESSTDAAPPGATSAPTALGARGQYDENGVDLSLIRANMRLTAGERARRAERARKAALRVQQIGRDSRRKPA
jgi:hypothetical protein